MKVVDWLVMSAGLFLFHSSAAAQPTTKTVASGQTVLVGSYTSLTTECKALGELFVHLDVVPEHGKLLSIPDAVRVHFPKNNPRYSCSENNDVPGLRVIYSAEPGYVGSDRAEGYVVTPSGGKIPFRFELLIVKAIQNSKHENERPVLQSSDLSKTEKIERLHAILRYPDRMAQQAEAARTLLVTSIRSKNRNMTVDELRTLNGVIREALEASNKILAADIRAIAERSYTDSELESLLAFLSTPEGATIANKMYEQSVELASQSRTFGATILAPEIKRRLRDNEVTRQLKF